MEKRAFRTQDSLEAEAITRRAVPKFLLKKGFLDVRDQRKKIGTSISQTIQGISPDGTNMRMRVKLCWRPTSTGNPYSAVQLVARIRTNDWEGELQAFVERANSEGVTHFLFVQRVKKEITEAALVPTHALIRIWCAQRDISLSLIGKGLLGRRKKNHAMNGSSPSLWLTDIQAPSVTNALWDDSDVQDLVQMQSSSSDSVDDTFADLLGIDVALLGSEGAAKMQGVKSYFKRSPQVRSNVIARAAGKCEGCPIMQAFEGFLDVHHILGVGTSDRVWNCVAICPNCHRAAHLAPNREEINSKLLAWSMKFHSNPNG